MVPIGPRGNNCHSVGWEGQPRGMRETAGSSTATYTFDVWALLQLPHWGCSRRMCKCSQGLGHA